MNIMKKMILLIAAALFVCGSVITSVSADMIYMPELKNGNYLEDVEYSYDYRKYEVSAKDGENALLYERPTDKKSSGTLKNGTVFYANTTYTGKDGQFWIFYEKRETVNVLENGWIKASEVTRQYDWDLFMADYKKDIKYTPETLSLEDLSQVVLYAYPTGPQEGIIKTGYSDEISFGQSYTDPSGNLWGFIHYYLGYRNYWVCLSHPEMEYDELQALCQELETRKETYPDVDDTSAEEVSESFGEERDTTSPALENEPSSTAVPETTAPSQPDTKTTAIPAIAASVGGVCVLTAAVLLFLKKKRR